MTRLIAPVIFVLSIIVVGMVLSSTGTPKNSQVDPKDITPFAVNDDIPNSSLVNAQSEKVELSQILKNPSLVVFWSAGCKECAPLLNDLKNNPEISKLQVLLINVQDAPAVAEAKLKELSVPFESYFDVEGQTFRNWSGTIPAAYYISQGKVLYFFPGRMSADHIASLLTLN